MLAIRKDALPNLLLVFAKDFKLSHYLDFACSELQQIKHNILRKVSDFESL